ncbi:S8 family peptidase [Butyrivibrio sp. AE3009]|uniref:S8 family peptidase n=1 Tax=Butyrivibrio sp. AE3009 TaxID=1280666 RepID=UPI0003B7120F|nr:S8 family serine peptidase [Butyrivibrio sp. AE3009]
MIKRSKVWVAALLAANMVVSQPALVLAQDVPADSEEIFLETDDEEYFSTDEDVTEEADFEFDMDLEEEALEDSVLPEEEVIEEDAELQESRIGGIALTASQKEYKANLRKAGKIDFSNLTAGVDYVAGEAIAPAATLEEAKAIAAAYGAKIKSLYYGIVVLDLTETDYSVEDAYLAGISEANYNLPAVEPNIMTVATEPNVEDEAEFASEPYGWDRSYYNFGYNDPGLNPDNGENYQWQHDMIHTYAAWGVTTGSSDVTVAVIDSGVQASHEDLKDRVKLANDFISNYAPDDDREGHGTHVAGIIAASVGNGVGGAGVAPGVNILAVNAVTVEGDLSYYTIADEARAVFYVAGYTSNFVSDEEGYITDYHFDKSTERRADIINMSIGGAGYYQAVQDAIAEAYKAGITVVVAMGNEYSNARMYPVGYEHVLAVASINEAGEKSNFSNYGDWCDIAAPGSNIYSTFRDIKNNPSSTKEYEVMSGTSMSTPVVAGACALYMSAYGHVAPDKMEEIVKASANKTVSKGMGAGIIDVAKMLGDTTAPTVTVTDLEGNQIAKAGGDNATATISGALQDAKVTITPENYGGDPKLLTGSKIVYTTNGKNPVVINGVIQAGCTYYEYDPDNNQERYISWFGYDEKKNKNMTVKIAVLTGSGVLSKVTTIKYTIKPQTVYKSFYWYASGPSYVVPGAKTKYSVVTNYKSKAATWSVDEKSAAKGITIDAKGNLLVPKTVTTGNIEITATSKDITDLYYVTYVSIIDEITKQVKLKADDPKELNSVVVKKDSVTSLTLFSQNIDEASGVDETTIHITPSFLTQSGADLRGKVSYYCTSTNYRIASPENEMMDGFDIIADQPGTATITVYPLDGSKKKATIKVKVITPASGIAITTKNNQGDYIGYGKSATAVAAIGNAYGKPTVTKVKWSYDIVGIYQDEDTTVTTDPLDEVTKKAIMKTKAFSFSKGKVTVGKQAAYGKAIEYLPYGYDFGFVVKATTTDGTNYTASKTYRASIADEGLAVCYQDDLYGDFHQITVDYYDDSEIGSYGGYFLLGKNGYVGTRFEVTSSKSSVATAYATIEKYGESYVPRLYVTAHGLGTTTIKIRALDGSNATTSIKIIVKDYR